MLRAGEAGRAVGGNGERGGCIDAEACPDGCLGIAGTVCGDGIVGVACGVDEVEFALVVEIGAGIGLG